jgi:hypothetical protein
MALSIDVGAAFVLFLVTLGYVPVLRAYTLERDSPWLVAGYTALVVGRFAAVAEAVTYPTLLNLLEHGVGIALAATLFSIHFYVRWQSEDSRYHTDRRGFPWENG